LQHPQSSAIDQNNWTGTGEVFGLQWHVGALRGRVDEIGLTREELDHLSGNQPGYSGKLLGKKQVKKFGKHSLGIRWARSVAIWCW
jgi:hypothetical protein